MITADEARAKAEAGILTQRNINRNSILVQIYNACDDGHFHCGWHGPIDDDFKKELEGHGFRVTKTDMGTYYEQYRIEWS